MVTHKDTWKSLERRICKKLGGKRTPLSGSNSGHHTSSDCIKLSPKFQQYYFEIRMREKFLHHNIFRNIEKQSEDKIPILFTQTKSNDKCLVVFKLEDFVELIKNEK